MDRSTRLVVGAVIFLAALAVVWWPAADRVDSSRPPHGADMTAASPSKPFPVARSTDTPRGSDPSREAAAPTPPEVEDLDAPDTPTPWAAVDMDAVRAALPDNLFWAMAMPTTDPAVVAFRREERTRWNEAYGKVLSNTATAEEVDAYYAQRQRLSNDYITFVSHVLLQYGEVLDQRDVAMLKLAAEMHLARLEEIPRQIADAHARRVAHERAREAWLADQRAFEGHTDTPR